jgi:hypothetical protein
MFMIYKSDFDGSAYRFSRRGVRSQIGIRHPLRAILESAFTGCER